MMWILPPLVTLLYHAAVWWNPTIVIFRWAQHTLYIIPLLTFNWHQTEAGDILVRGIKTECLNIKTFSGEVTCVGAVQGRVFVDTGDGNVVGKGRFLGPQLEVSTDAGDINISSCYSDQSKFVTRRGSMELKNMHNISSVEVTEE